MKIVLLGNLSYPHSTENHHLQALTDLGHDVSALQEGVTTAAGLVSAARTADLLVWVHTHQWQTPGGIVAALRELRRSKTAIIGYHLDLWHGLRREHLLSDPDYYVNLVDHFFSVDPQMADHVNRRGRGRGHWLPAAVSHRECWMAPGPTRDLDVVFVGSHRYHPEWPHRGRLLLALTERYGNNFHVVPGPGPAVRGPALNRLYGRSKVVVGDSLCPGYGYRGYWSDRVYESLGRGALLVHPRVPGLEAQFTDGEHLSFYDFQNFDQVFAIVDSLLQNDHEADRIRRAGHAEVHARHTYLHRWQTILEAIR